MPDWIWFFVAFTVTAFGFLAVVILLDRGWALWKRYRHENGKPDLRPFEPPDDLPPDPPD